MPNIKRANTSGITKSGVAISDVPDAPTIGTVTSSGLSASVPYTAATTGGTATTFTAISTPGSITATGSSPITVTGLTDGTSYTFTVRGSNSTGTGPISASSNSITAIEPVSGAYDSLATILVPTGGVTSVSFVGIPQGYKHLQIRALYNTVTNPDNIGLTLNGTVGSSQMHYMYGNATGSTGVIYTGTDTASFLTLQAGVSTTTYYGAIFDLLDYTNTLKHKTVRATGGIDLNGSGVTYLSTGFYATSSVSSISIQGIGGQTLAAKSRFALYGVK
jgi:hypothetical protein